MEDKKFLPVKIIHLVLVAFAAVFCIFSMVQGKGGAPITYITNIVTVIALGFGYIYFLGEYKKSAAVFYKIFMALAVFAKILGISGSLSAGVKVSPVFSALTVISVVVLSILTTAKDLGKTLSYIAAALLILCELILLIAVIVAVEGFAASSLAVLSEAVSRFLLAVTVGITVAAKYIDKTARGTK